MARRRSLRPCTNALKTIIRIKCAMEEFSRLGMFFCKCEGFQDSDSQSIRAAVGHGRCYRAHSNHLLAEHHVVLLGAEWHWLACLQSQIGASKRLLWIASALCSEGQQCEQGAHAQHVSDWHFMYSVLSS